MKDLWHLTLTLIKRYPEPKQYVKDHLSTLIFMDKCIPQIFEQSFLIIKIFLVYNLYHWQSSERGNKSTLANNSCNNTLDPFSVTPVTCQESWKEIEWSYGKNSIFIALASMDYCVVCFFLKCVNFFSWWNNVFHKWSNQ